MNDSLKHAAADILENYLKVRPEIKTTQPLSGGDINRALMLETTAGKFFMKFNSASRYPGMFKAEAEGLQLMKFTETVAVPEVIGYGEDGRDAFLLLQYIEPGYRSETLMEKAGQQLARMHRHSSPFFGLHSNNYIGSLIQKNTLCKSWSEFFASSRIEPMLKMARDKGLVDAQLVKAFSNLLRRLDDLIPAEPPGLLHGDLWGGNYLTSSNGQVYLIDPAVYYGHREMDLSMTRLFGGFPESFYAGYEAEYPLQAGFKQRIAIHNLYPLLVHVNLFGGGYVSSVAAIVKKFV